MKISVIIPTLGNGALDSILESYSEADEVLILQNKNKQCIDNFNDLGMKAEGDILVQVNDRCIIKPGWRKAVEKEFDIIKSGVVSFAPIFVTNGAISRDYMKKYQMGCVLVPEYIHHYADLEMAQKAKSLNLYREIENYISIFPKKKKPVDYKKMVRQLIWDIRTYWRRKKAGFPNYLTVDMKKRDKYVYVH